MELISVEEYRALFQHVYTALGGRENIPASFAAFQERTEHADIEQDTAMRLFRAAYQDVCNRCSHQLRHTLNYLIERYPTSYRRTVEVLVWLGARCDCELLMNVGMDEYAERRYEPIGGDMDVWEWNRLIDSYIHAGARLPSHKSIPAHILVQQHELW